MTTFSDDPAMQRGLDGVGEFIQFLEANPPVIDVMPEHDLVVNHKYPFGPWCTVHRRYEIDHDTATKQLEPLIDEIYQRGLDAPEAAEYIVSALTADPVAEHYTELGGEG